MSRSRSLLLLALLAPATLASCASIVSHSSWPVNVTASPADAEVQITNQAGAVVHKAKAPFTVSLRSGAGYFDGERYTLTASAPGYAQNTCVLDTGVNGWYVGNVVFGGLIGFLIVDPASGAMYRLPETTHVELVKAGP